jgi:hypothetical protein
MRIIAAVLHAADAPYAIEPVELNDPVRDVTHSRAWRRRRTGQLRGGVPPTQTSNSGCSPPR